MARLTNEQRALARLDELVSGATHDLDDAQAWLESELEHAGASFDTPRRARLANMAKTMGRLTLHLLKAQITVDAARNGEFRDLD